MAVLRRFFGLLPYLGELPFAWQFHFDGRTPDGRLVLSVSRKHTFPDRYQLTSYDPALDALLLAVFGVVRYALQHR